MISFTRVWVRKREKDYPNLTGPMWKSIPTPTPTLLNPDLIVISHIFWKAGFNFTDHNQAWLLPNLSNQEIT